MRCWQISWSLQNQCKKNHRNSTFVIISDQIQLSETKKFFIETMRNELKSNLFNITNVTDFNIKGTVAEYGPENKLVILSHWHSRTSRENTFHWNLKTSTERPNK